MKCFKFIVTSFFACMLVASCEEYPVDFPPIQEQGNVMVFFTPGQKLRVEAALAGKNLEVINDSNRVQSTLFENGLPVDEFLLEGNYQIQWSKTYRLEVLIDDKYLLSGAVQIPDSISAKVLDTTSLAERVFGRVGQGYAARKTTVIVTQNLPDTIFTHEQQHSGGAPNEVLTNAEPYFALPANKSDTVVFHNLLATSTLDISFIGPEYVRFIRSARLSQASGELSPQPVSYSNIEGGAGLMTFYYPITFE